MDVNRRLEDGGTALIAAATAGDAEALEALLSAGADPQLTLPDGRTALDLARENNHPEAIQALTQREQQGCWGIGCAMKRLPLPTDSAVPQPHPRTENHSNTPTCTAQDPRPVAIPPLDGTQLTAAAADSVAFTTVVDLIPRLGDRPCIVPTDARGALTYTALRKFIESRGYGDHKLLARGNRVVLGLPNGPEAAVAFLALGVRCTVAPLNVAVTTAEATFELANLPAAAVITLEGSPSGDVLRGVAAAAGIPQLLLQPDSEIAGLFRLTPADPPPTTELAPGQAAAGEVRSEEPDAWLGRDDVCLLLHTSGTTLKPKLVPLTHRNLGTAALCIRSTLQLQPSDVGLNVMPLHHLHGIMVNVLVSIVSGASVVCTEGWSDPALFFDQCRLFKPTWYSAVPSMHLAIVLHAERVRMRTGELPSTCLRLARNCSAALSAGVAARLEAALECTVLPTYAMSECVPICSNPRFGKVKLGSVGRPAGPEVRLLVQAEAQAEGVAPAGSLDIGTGWFLTSAGGVEGEVCVKGACCTAGYEFRDHMDPTFSAHVGDGWLRTGDKGYFDPDGYLFLTGRFKELINRAAEKLSPLLIEDVLCTCEAVAGCIVFACPHAELGEAVGVAVVEKPGAGVTLRDLRSHMLDADQIQAKWLPECLVIVPRLLKGPTGKPQRIGLANVYRLPQLSHRGSSSLGATWRAIDDGSGGWTLEEVHTNSTGAIDESLATPCLGDRISRGVEQAAVDVLCVGALSTDAVLMDTGLDSITAVVLVDRLCAEFDVELEPTILDACPTIDHLVRKIRSLVGHRPETERGPGLWCEYQAGADEATEPAPEAHDPPTTATSKSAKRSHAAQKGRATLKAERRAKFEGAAGPRKVESAAVEGSSLFLAKNGDKAGLRLAAESGVNLNAVVDRHGLTPLQWAAGGGHLGAVQYLVDEAKSPVDRANKEGRTPLMWACRNGHLEVAQFLAERGADVKAVTRKGVSALHWATWGGSIDVAKWLLTQGLDLEALSNAGCNCAVWAAAAGRISMCEFLLQRGADFGRVNFWGHGVVSKASWHGHTDMLRWLFTYAGVLDQLFIINHVGETPVELAEQAGHLQTRDFMLQTMQSHPHVFTPFQGNPDVHQHKQQKILGGMYDEM